MASRITRLFTRRPQTPKPLTKAQPHAPSASATRRSPRTAYLLNRGAARVFFDSVRRAWGNRPDFPYQYDVTINKRPGIDTTQIRDAKTKENVAFVYFNHGVTTIEIAKHDRFLHQVVHDLMRTPEDTSATVTFINWRGNVEVTLTPMK